MLLLWSTVARAALSEEEAALEIQRIQSGSGEQVLIGAVGPEAEKVADRLLRMHGGLNARVARLPSAGEPAREEARALAESELRCGVRLAPDPITGWLVTPFGDCDPLPLQAAALAPTTAAVSKGPPAVDKRLRVEARAGGWAVTDRDHRALTAPALAALLSDTPTLEELAREQRAARATTRAFRIGGSILLASALLPLLDMPPASTPAGEDRVWTTLFLGSAGSMALIAAPWAEEGLATRQADPRRYYTRAEVDAAIEQYNHALQQQLGLAPVEEPIADPAPDPVEEPNPANDPVDEPAPPPGEAP